MTDEQDIRIDEVTDWEECRQGVLRTMIEEMLDVIPGEFKASNPIRRVRELAADYESCVNDSNRVTELEEAVKEIFCALSQGQTERAWKIADFQVHQKPTPSVTNEQTSGGEKDVVASVPAPGTSASFANHAPARGPEEAGINYGEMTDAECCARGFHRRNLETDEACACGYKEGRPRTSEPMVNGRRPCPGCGETANQRMRIKHKPDCSVMANPPVDPMHPNGRCTCAGEGRCEWCVTSFNEEMGWRVGRKLGRTLYLNGDCVGMVDTPRHAQVIVEALKAYGACSNEAMRDTEANMMIEGLFDANVKLDAIREERNKLRDYARLVFPLVEGVREIFVKHYPSGSDPNHDEPRRRMATLVRLACNLRDLSATHEDLSRAAWGIPDASDVIVPCPDKAKKDDVVERLAKWIVNLRIETWTILDHACARCRPTSSCLVEGFTCAYHLAHDIVMPRPETATPEEKK
jgi:hypothetical protein